MKNVWEVTSLAITELFGRYNTFNTDRPLNYDTVKDSDSDLIGMKQHKTPFYSENWYNAVYLHIFYALCLGWADQPYSRELFMVNILG